MQAQMHVQQSVKQPAQRQNRQAAEQTGDGGAIGGEVSRLGRGEARSQADGAEGALAIISPCLLGDRIRGLVWRRGSARRAQTGVL